MIQEIRSSSVSFPSPHEANEDGIVAWGGDLHPLRVLNAYQNGIFPWYSRPSPILWWSPNPRLIMELDDFKLSRSLKKSMKKFEYKINTNFSEVMRKCATKDRNNQDGTWINEEIINAYTAIHNMGYAHSVETYQNGVLVGGLYGIAIGGIFCGESMFADVNDASKSAYAVLVKHLKKWGFSFIDCQVPTDHLKSLGAKEVSRDEFLEALEIYTHKKNNQEWKIEEELINI